MAKAPSNSGDPWTEKDKAKIERMVKQNHSTAEIAKSLGRTTAAVYVFCSRNGITLMSHNR